MFDLKSIDFRKVATIGYRCKRNTFKITHNDFKCLFGRECNRLLELLNRLELPAQLYLGLQSFRYFGFTVITINHRIHTKILLNCIQSGSAKIGTFFNLPNFVPPFPTFTIWRSHWKYFCQLNHLMHDRLSHYEFYGHFAFSHRCAARSDDSVAVVLLLCT